MTRVKRILLAALLPAPLALGAMLTPGPVILLNTSASEPLGLYRRVAAPPRVGALIAFRPPDAALGYLRTALPGRARGSILKGVVAGPGMLACADARLSVNGWSLGPIGTRDRAGRPLPRWRGCHRLAAGEFIVFSNRIPNSFDSRYYGPVRDAEILGVYAPWWTWDA